MARKRVYVIASVLVVLGLLIGGFGCAAPTPTPTPQVYNFKLAMFQPTTHWAYTDIVVPFAQTVKEKSGGRINIEIYPAQTLVTVLDTPKALQAGVTDIGVLVPDYHPTLFPLHEVWVLPYMGTPARPTPTVIDDTLDYLELYDKFFKEFSDKLNLHQLGGQVIRGFDIFMTSKPLYRIEDLKGLTLAVPSAPAQKVVEILGAVPIRMPFPEVYDALQKGTVQGVVAFAMTLESQKFYETGKPGYLIQLHNIPGNTMVILMNKTRYESLPKDLRKIIDDAGRESLSLKWAQKFDDMNRKAFEFFTAKGVKTIVWDKAEKKRLDTLMAPLWDEWAKQAEAKGLRGSEVVAAVNALLKKSRK